MPRKGIIAMQQEVCVQKQMYKGESNKSRSW